MKRYCLKDVCEFYAGTGFPMEYQGNADGQYPFYKVGDISENVLANHIHLQKSRNYVDADVAAKLKGTIIPAGTVVFAKIGEALRLNRRAITACDCLIDNNAMGIRANSTGLSPKYFFYFMKNLDMSRFASATTAPSVRKSILENLQIKLPSYEEQETIAVKLDILHDLIVNRKRVLALLDELVKSRFVEMFGDPVINDRQFPVMKFSEIASSRLGKMLDKKNQTGKCAFPYLANYNVQWFRFDLSSLNTMDFTEADRQEFELRKGDLLVCEGGEVGRCAIWNNELEHCYFQKALHRVRCDTSVILPEYLAFTFLLHSKYNGFEDAISGVSTIAHLPGDRLKKLQVIVPPLPLQQKFAAFVHQVDAAKAAARREMAALETLRGKMMQEFFG